MECLKAMQYAFSFNVAILVSALVRFLLTNAVGWSALLGASFLGNCIPALTCRRLALSSLGNMSLIVGSLCTCFMSAWLSLATCQEPNCASPCQHLSLLFCIHLCTPIQKDSCCRLDIFMFHVGCNSIYIWLWAFLCFLSYFVFYYFAWCPLYSMKFFGFFFLLVAMIFALFVPLLYCLAQDLLTFCSFFDCSKFSKYFHHHFLITYTIYKLFFEPSVSFFVTKFIDFQSWLATSIPLHVSLFLVNLQYCSDSIVLLCCGLNFHWALITALHLPWIFLALYHWGFEWISVPHIPTSL